MAEILDARVKQKTGTAAEFAGYTLLEGEIALVRTSSSGPVFNFKVGPGNFDSLDWSLQNPGAAQKADTSTEFPSGVPGLYIPTEDGTYEGVTVDLSSGYTQLIWDGANLVDVVFPIDLAGYATTAEVAPIKDTVDSVTEPYANLYNRSEALENQRFLTSASGGNQPGDLVTASGFLAFELTDVSYGYYSVLVDVSAISYCRFDSNGDYVSHTTPSKESDGRFIVSVPAGIASIGLTLMNDGNFERPVIIQRGDTIDLDVKVKFDSIDRKGEITLNQNIIDIGTNLINKAEIQFGKQVTSGGIIESSQMYVEITPLPEPGTYAVSGVANLSVFSKTSGAFSGITRTIVGNYFTFVVPSGIDALYLNLAASSSDWWRADTAMMNAGASPLPYSPYGDKIKPSLLPDTRGENTINFNQLPNYPENGTSIFLKDRYASFIYSDGWNPTDGTRIYTAPRGKIYGWDFSGGSLAADGVTKSAGLTINSENYDTGVGYSIDVPSQTNLYEYISLNNSGIRTLEFQQEIIELTIDRLGSGSVGVLYKGETVGRIVNSLAGITGTGIFLREAVGAIPNTYSLNRTANGTITEDNQYRIIHDFFGNGRRVSVYDISSGEPVEVSSLDIVWPMTGSGSYPERPNNRSLGLVINDMGVTITKYELHTFEPNRADTIITGDSISVSRTASAYEKGWAKLATQFIGSSALLHGGGSNTCEDILNSLEDTLAMKPKRVVLAIGTNDCNLNKTNRYTEHQSIVSQLETAGAEVIICNVIPADNDGTTPSQVARWERIQDWNDWLTSTYPSHTIIDNFTSLVNDDGDDWNETYRADELHPNDNGHAVMFENLKTYL